MIFGSFIETLWRQPIPVLWRKGSEWPISPTDTHRTREKESCDGNGNETGGAVVVENIEEREGDEDMQNLLEAMRNLTHVYSILADSNRLCGRTNLETEEEASSEPHTTTTTTTTTPLTGMIVSYR